MTLFHSISNNINTRFYLVETGVEALELSSGSVSFNLEICLLILIIQIHI